MIQSNRGLSSSATLVLALGCGVAVANVYFPQAIISLIARSFDVSSAKASLVSTAAQAGYAAGIFLVVPLGDRLIHRRLIPMLAGLCAACLLTAGAAPNITVLIAASAAAGFLTVIPQIILPMAAGLTDPARRGAVTGTLLSGLLAGILLARTVSGILGDIAGWRVAYFVAAGLSLAVAIALRRVIPATVPSTSIAYPRLVAESVKIFTREPQLRRSALYQGLIFGGFTATWTVLSLLVTGPVFGFSTSVVGLIALVGAASVFVSPFVGRQIDLRGPDRINTAAFILVLGAVGILFIGGLGHLLGLAGLVIGMVLLDTGTQAGQTANQARIFGLRPDARSRVNTAYMTCAFIGGSAGSWIGVKIYTSSQNGWYWVCAAVLGASLIGIARHAVYLIRVSSTSATGVVVDAADLNH